MAVLGAEPSHRGMVVRPADSTCPGVGLTSMARATTPLCAFIALAMAVGVPAAQEKPDHLAALAQAEARWRERGPKSYEYQVRVQCFCLAEMHDKVRVINGVTEP